MTRLADRLRVLYPEASGRAFKQWLGEGRVRVNGAVVRRGDVALGAGDRVELAARADLARAPFPIVHEDDDIVVIDKPPGLLTIATEQEHERTAYRMLGDYIASRSDTAARDGAGARATAPGPPRVFIVHRLDRETSGLLCFAKSGEAKTRLQAQFAARAVERVYVAVVEGRVRDEAGTLAGRVVEHGAGRVRLTRDTRRGREALTHYRVLARRRHVTTIELSLVTGRRGQLRAQLAALGHPIVGDAAYGSGRDPLRRVCLHATRLALRHPRGHDVRFESPMPPAFARV